MRYQIHLDGQSHELELASAGAGRYLARLRTGEQRRELEVTVLSDRPTLAVLIDGQVVELSPVAPGQAGARGARSAARLVDASESRRGAQRAGASAAGATMRAPMPGRIVKVLVAPGQVVSAGQPALVIEAMKMENELACPAPGEVQRVAVAPGDAVERGAVLVEIGKP